MRYVDVVWRLIVILAVVIYLALGGTANAQTRRVRHGGHRHGRSAQVTAPPTIQPPAPALPSAVPAVTPSTTTPPPVNGTGPGTQVDLCPNAAESARLREQAQALIDHRTGHEQWEGLLTQAIALCGRPDRYERRAIAREQLATRLGLLGNNEAEQLRLLSGAIADYEAAVARAAVVQGFQTTHIESALRDLRPRRDALEARLHPPTVTPTLVCRTNQRVCGNACADTRTDRSNCGACGTRCGQGFACVASRCVAASTMANANAIAPTLPGATLPSMLGPWAVIGAGGATFLTGVAFLATGLAAQDAQDKDNSIQALQPHLRCDQPVPPAPCVGYAPGATRPGDVAAWATPAGGVLMGVGAAVTAGGIIWRVRRGVTRDQASPVSLHAEYLPGGGRLVLQGQF